MTTGLGRFVAVAWASSSSSISLGSRSMGLDTFWISEMGVLKLLAGAAELVDAAG